MLATTLTLEQFKVFTDQAKADIGHFRPELLIICLVAGILLANVFLKREDSRLLAWPSLLGTLGALWLVLARYGGEPAVIFNQSLRIDRFADFFSVVFLVGTAVSIVLAALSKELESRPMGEFYAILLSAVLGMMLMAEATDLLMIFVAVELLSVPSYILTGWIKKSRVSSEAALKYVIYGSVSAGLMLYGFSLFYGMTGSLKLSAIASLVQGHEANAMAVALASFLAFGGFGYKMAAVPMQFWAPDVYQGAPTAVTGWLSVTSKAAGVAVFIRFVDALGLGRSPVGEQLDWVSLVALLSAITMTLGNLGALHQTNLKRLLAYSSVAHVGYILMGVAAFGSGAAGGMEGWKAVAFYVVAYLIMNLGAFACIILGANQLGSEDVSAFRGFGYRAPRLAFAFAVFIFALIGIPPTAGFTGKFQLFVVAINQGLVWLAVVAAVNTAISAYYYVKILRALYLEESAEGELRIPALGEALVAAHLVAVIYFGLFFGRLAEWTQQIGQLHQ
jgi:NADH-quinone oxidoreductase subunit N